MEALTIQQRRKRSIISKKKAKVTAIKRKKMAAQGKTLGGERIKKRIG